MGFSEFHFKSTGKLRERGKVLLSKTGVLTFFKADCCGTDFEIINFYRLFYDTESTKLGIKPAVADNNCSAYKASRQNFATVCLNLKSLLQYYGVKMDKDLLLDVVWVEGMLEIQL